MILEPHYYADGKSVDSGKYGIYITNHGNTTYTDISFQTYKGSLSVNDLISYMSSVEDSTINIDPWKLQGSDDALTILVNENNYLTLEYYYVYGGTGGSSDPGVYNFTFKPDGYWI